MNVCKCRILIGLMKVKLENAAVWLRAWNYYLLEHFFPSTNITNKLKH